LGFGNLCEKQCFSKPCNNNGSSMDLTNRFLCNGEPSYHGTSCELNINKYENSLCPEGENCVNRTCRYIFLCAHAFYLVSSNVGIDCEVNIDECLSKPCLHDGTCVDGIDHYTCDCKSGFSGTHCEEKANDCLLHPCLHGRCIDFIDKYQYSCDTEWTSSRYEIKINDCISNLCMDEAFCKKAAHGFTFIFLNGTYCEINISSCAEPELSMALCLNGTICAKGPGHTLCCRSEYIYPEII
ncbi:unnamed protein product, partial [Rangifer tarandus platyrhynchus]